MHHIITILGDVFLAEKLMENYKTSSDSKIWKEKFENISIEIKPYNDPLYQKL